MKFVALLRGINVGGNNKVDMKLLKSTFERLGFTAVKTYINSGNIIFESNSPTPQDFVAVLEKAITEDFGLAIKVLVRDMTMFEATAKALPDHWQNGGGSKCDVMFLWEEIDAPSVVDALFINPTVDEVVYTPGAVIWRIDRDNFSQSGMSKLVGTKIYKQMTVRNCNTLRKLAKLMKDPDA